MPLGPLGAACVQPAPKSRFVVSGLLRFEDQQRSALTRLTLRVVTQQLTLCVNVDAERPGRHSHAERWNDRSYQK
jgi:hypothetical protein